MSLSNTNQDTLNKVNKVKKVKKSKKKRCYICKKKLGLIPFTCRCERHFCSLHRYAEDHQCKFDYSYLQLPKWSFHNLGYVLLVSP